MNVLTRIPERNAVVRPVGHLFNELLGHGPSQVDTWLPAIDAIETKDALLVTFELPGVDPDAIETSVTAEHLEISGRKLAPEKADDAKWYRFERQSGSFRRRIRLPFPVDLDAVEATAKNGLLTVRLPKRPEMLPKKIAVQSG